MAVPCKMWALSFILALGRGLAVGMSVLVGYWKALNAKTHQSPEQKLAEPPTHLPTPVAAHPAGRPDIS